MNANVKWAMGGFGLAATLGMGLAMGPLSPPAGPVAETEPSLAELEAKIDALSTSGTNDGWNVAFIATYDDADQLNAVLVAPGRVEVRSSTVYWAGMSLFDGPGGTVDGNGIPLNPTSAVHHNYHFIANGGGGTNQSPSQLSASIIVENGLYIAYRTLRATSVIQVEYRTLGE